MFTLVFRLCEQGELRGYVQDNKLTLSEKQELQTSLQVREGVMLQVREGGLQLWGGGKGESGDGMRSRSCRCRCR